MAKYVVTLTRTTTQSMVVTITAKDEEDAQEKTETWMRKLDYDAEKIATHYKEAWEYDNEEIIVDDVQEG